MVTRPGYEVSIEHVGAEMGARIVDVRDLTGELSSQVRESGVPKIFVTDAVMHDISATEVRRAARENRQDLDNLVPLEVADYIRKYKLYRNTHEA